MQTLSKTSVNNPFIKMLVYHGADYIAYKYGYFLKCQYLYSPEPMNIPINEPMIIFSI